MYFDFSYLIYMLPALIFAMYAQWLVSHQYSKYSKIRNTRGLSGTRVARMILDSCGLHNVAIMPAGPGTLSDHYDPRNRCLYLSNAVMEGASVASMAVAAHECGHAIQHGTNYPFLGIRNLMVSTTNLSSNLSYLTIMIGFIFDISGLITLGILLFTVVVVFHLITLPVEFNASSRARAQIASLGIITSDEESRSVAKVLNAAALTYVAALVTSLMTLLRYVMLSRRRRS